MGCSCNEPVDRPTPKEIAMMKDVVDENIHGDGHSIDVSREDLYLLGEQILDKILGRTNG